MMHELSCVLASISSHLLLQSLPLRGLHPITPLA